MHVNACCAMQSSANIVGVHIVVGSGDRITVADGA